MRRVPQTACFSAVRAFRRGAKGKNSCRPKHSFWSCPALATALGSNDSARRTGWTAGEAPLRSLRGPSRETSGACARSRPVPSARSLTQSDSPLLHASSGETFPAVASLQPGLPREEEPNQSARASARGRAALVPTRRAARLTEKQNPKVIGQKEIYPAPITGTAGGSRRAFLAGGFKERLCRDHSAGTTDRCQARRTRPSVLPCPCRRPAPGGRPGPSLRPAP